MAAQRSLRVCCGSGYWKEDDQVSTIDFADKVHTLTRPRYVDYAMHRVRLLRHLNIQPYIVFDGGPLPAKRGTDSERKRKRDDNLAEGNRLASQGKHKQARDYYVKCVDVSPEMAYQLIKVCIAHVLYWRTLRLHATLSHYFTKLTFTP